MVLDFHQYSFKLLSVDLLLYIVLKGKFIGQQNVMCQWRIYTDYNEEVVSDGDWCQCRAD